MSDDKPVQHTPAHLAEDADVFDPRHPAASPFAVAQPGAGVVANDADELGQNLAGGPKADDANREYSDQKEVLAENYQRDLRAKSGVGDGGAVEVDGDSAKPAAGADSAKDSGASAGKASSPRSASTPPPASPRA